MSWPVTEGPILEGLHGELGQRLLNSGQITQAQLDQAMRAARESGQSLVEALVNLKLVPKSLAYDELAGLYGVPFVDLKTYSPDPAASSLIEEKVARELEVFPLFLIGNTLTLALADPNDVTTMDRISAAVGYHVEPCLAAREEIRAALNQIYGQRDQAKEFLEKTDSAVAAPGTGILDAQQAVVQNRESPVSRLVDLLIAQAVRDRASDIHIDPEEDEVQIRFRIDGVLYEIPPPPKYFFPFVISRLKVMSNMDIGDSRLPQEGQFRVTVENRTVEARVASMPTIHGECMAIRLLESQAAGITLENLGISGPLLGSIEAMIQRPHGMVVVAGPTGSGKSTTLYAMLLKTRTVERKIVTIEDPVERWIKSVTQVQVNEKAGLVYASALRSILRQDPDVIMVGEIRDEDTAQLAVRAALTGRLLFSTLPTNDAVGTVIRLTDMHIEPFLVASSLIGTIAQRLVRLICPECKEQMEVTPGLRKRLMEAGIEIPDALWRGQGCARCRGTGYNGRTAIFEGMAVSSQMAELIVENAGAGQLREQARREGMVRILEEGMAKVRGGLTTITEVLRIAELGEYAERSKVSAVVAGRAEREIEHEPIRGVPPRMGLNLEQYQKSIANWLAGHPGVG